MRDPVLLDLADVARRHHGLIRRGLKWSAGVGVVGTLLLLLAVGLHSTGAVATGWLRPLAALAIAGWIASAGAAALVALADR